MENLIGISGKAGSGKDTVGKIIQYLNWKNKIEKGESKSLHYTIENFLNGNISFVTDWKIKKFADKLKDMVCILIGCTREQLENREFKNTPLPEEWWYYKIQKDVSNSYGSILLPYIGNENKNHLTLYKLTPRRLLQLLGTNCGRDIIHPNIWVLSLFADYKIKSGFGYTNDAHTQCTIIKKGKYPKWIITDMRFPNELEAVKDRSGLTIRVNRNIPKEQDINQSLLGAMSNYNEHLSETALDNAKFDVVIENDGSINDLLEKVTEVYNKYVK